MRKTLAVAALMLAFCCPALAGEIPNPPASKLAGEIPTPPAPQPQDGTDGLTQTVLDLLAALPFLF